MKNDEKHLEVFYSGQITSEDLANIADNDIKLIICNRPDGEVEGQPKFEALQKQAKALGIEMVYLPIDPKDFGSFNPDALIEILEKQEGPVLAYCGSGKRAQYAIDAVQQKINQQ